MDVFKIDASIIPIHISAHPQTTVYAFAERVCGSVDVDLFVLTNLIIRLQILSGRPTKKSRTLVQTNVAWLNSWL